MKEVFKEVIDYKFVIVTILRAFSLSEHGIQIKKNKIKKRDEKSSL